MQQCRSFWSGERLTELPRRHGRGKSNAQVCVSSAAISTFLNERQRAKTLFNLEEEVSIHACTHSKAGARVLLLASAMPEYKRRRMRAVEGFLCPTLFQISGRPVYEPCAAYEERQMHHTLKSSMFLLRRGVSRIMHGKRGRAEKHSGFETASLVNLSIDLQIHRIHFLLWIQNTRLRRHCAGGFLEAIHTRSTMTALVFGTMVFWALIVDDVSRAIFRIHYRLCGCSGLALFWRYKAEARFEGRQWRESLARSVCTNSP